MQLLCGGVAHSQDLRTPQCLELSLTSSCREARGETDRGENKMGVKSLALFSALIPVPSCSFAFFSSNSQKVGESLLKYFRRLLEKIKFPHFLNLKVSYPSLRFCSVAHMPCNRRSIPDLVWESLAWS